MHVRTHFAVQSCIITRACACFVHLFAHVFIGREVNPFAEYIVGGYNAGGAGSSAAAQCTNFNAVRTSLRNFLRAWGGDKSTETPAASASGPLFCMYRPDLLVAGSKTWTDASYAPGTCARQDYTLPTRLCVPYSVPAGQPGAPLTGVPVTVNGLVGPARDNLFPRSTNVPSNGRAEGASTFIPNVRSVAPGVSMAR